MKNRKIKVIHVCDKFGVKGSSIHGVSRLFSWWMPCFNKDRYDVRLVGLREPDKATEDLKNRGVEVTSLGKGKFDFSTVGDIVQILKHSNADILHLHGYGASNFGQIAARIARVKVIIHEHFTDPAMPKYQVPFDYFLSRYADIGIAVSHSVKEFMVKERFLPEKRIRVIFNGVPLEEFKPVDREMRNKEREKWGIPDEHKVIATIGRLDEQKGNRFFIDAALCLLGKGHKVKFMLIGDGPLLIELKEQCSRLHIENDVIFTGYRSNIPLIQSIIDLQVFPSLWEGTPLTLFEAMSMKLPIVSTTADGLGEVLRDEENAMLVNPRDSEGLATAIEHLLNNTEKAKEIAAQAHKDSYNYNIENTISHIQDVYEELIA